MSDPKPVWAESVADARVGERLWFKSSYGGREVVEVEVVKRGRTLLTVSAPSGWPRQSVHRMETGHESGHVCGHPDIVFTESQRQLSERMVEVNAKAKAIGLERGLGRRIPDEAWEEIVNAASAILEAHGHTASRP